MKIKNNWKKIIIKDNSRIKDAIDNLNMSSMQIILVINNLNQFIGTITDGDIRRGFLSGFNLETKISKIFNSKPIFVDEHKSYDDCLRMMETHGINQIPIVDKNKNIIGLYSNKKTAFKSFIDTTIVIMAGGRGKRLMPLTSKMPKPMLEVSGKPILEHILLNAKKQGFKNFMISVNYLSDIIKKYFGSGENIGINISYIEEKTPLGTIGSIKIAEKKLFSRFIVIYSDLITNIDLSKFLKYHIKNNAAASMAIRPYEWTNPFGVVRLDGLKIKSFQEKPVKKININAGVYIFEPEAFKFIENNEYIDAPTLFERLKKNEKKIIAYPLYETWLDIGRVEDYKNAKEIK